MVIHIGGISHLLGRAVSSPLKNKRRALSHLLFENKEGFFSSLMFFESKEGCLISSFLKRMLPRRAFSLLPGIYFD